MKIRVKRDEEGVKDSKAEGRIAFIEEEIVYTHGDQ